MNGSLKSIVQIITVAIALVAATWTTRNYIDDRIASHHHVDLVERLARIEEKLDRLLEDSR